MTWLARSGRSQRGWAAASAGVVGTVCLLLRTASAASIPVCPDARYVIPPDAAPLVVGAQAPEIVVIDGGRISITSGCAPVQPKKHRGTRRGTQLAASWSLCGSTGKVRLTARIVDDCRAMTGIRRARRVRARRFTAIMSECGDGIVDAGNDEDCDRSRCDGGGVCTDCHCLPPSTTVTTTTSTSSSSRPSSSTTSTTTSTASSSSSSSRSSTSTSTSATTSTSTSSSTTSTSSTTTLSPLCGNGHLDAGEECDDADLGDHTCPLGSAGGGFLLCQANCTIDASHCQTTSTTSTSTSTSTSSSTSTSTSTSTSRSTTSTSSTTTSTRTTSSTRTSTSTSTRTTTSTTISTVRFATQVVPILTGTCIDFGCHSNGGPAAQGLDLSTAAKAYMGLVNVTAAECAAPRVDPSSPATSYLMSKISGVGPCTPTTPMPAGKPSLSPSDVSIIRAWITQGALNN